MFLTSRPSLQPQNGHSSQINGKPSRRRSCKLACSCVSMVREALKDPLLAPSLYINHSTLSYELLLNLVIFFYELLWFKSFLRNNWCVCMVDVVVFVVRLSCLSVYVVSGVWVSLCVHMPMCRPEEGVDHLPLFLSDRISH